MILRDYQVNIATKANEVLLKHGIVYLAMQVRTGKTHTALYTAKLFGAKRVLFVTKKKAIKSIVSDATDAGYEYQIKVTNYEAIHHCGNDFDFIIIDEAHSLGSFPKLSLRAKIIKIRYHKLPVIFLSGTPTPESYSQIFHQLYISDKSPFAMYSNFYRWADTFVDKKEKHLNGFTFIDYSGAKEPLVKSAISHLVINYTQKEAGFSCEVKENIVDIEESKIPALIKRLFKDRILNIDGSIIVADTPAKLMSKAHQISGGTVICQDGSTKIICTAKAESIKAEFTNKKIAIYYKFIGELTILEKVFCGQLTQSPEEFQQRNDKIFVSQILSGREGIALHSADAIVFYNIDYSATSYWQARARLQSLTRTTPAYIYWIFNRGGIEQHVYSAVTAKKDFTLSYFNKIGGIKCL